MKNTTIKTLGTVDISAMLAFVAFMVMPAGASADYYGGSYHNNYDYGYQNSHYQNLQVSCSSNTSSMRVGDSVIWSANVYGGSGSYYYNWSGTDGLYEYGQTLSKIYYDTGYKSASVSVTSGGQTVSANCSSAVNVYGTNYNNPPVYNPPTYYPPTYYPPTYYSPLVVSCNGSNSYYNNNYYNNNGYYNNGYYNNNYYNNNTGNNIGSVTWTAYASGGSGYYTYTWSGTDGLYGSGQSLYYNYSVPGLKYASVTVYSNGQTITQSCASPVNVGNYVATYPVVYGTSATNNLDVACYSDPATIRANQPTTWTAEATGGVAPYSYSWTGSDGLSGTQASTIKYYGSTGEKNAIVTVTSADGKTGTRACSNTVTVRGSVSSAAPYKAPVQQDQPPQQNTYGQSAAALFSLQNVPWGWIAILVILVLFATVIYLLFNRTKV